MATIVSASPAVSTRTVSAIQSFDNSLTESVFANAFTSTMISTSTSITYPYTSNTPAGAGPVNTTYWITG